MREGKCQHYIASDQEEEQTPEIRGKSGPGDDRGRPSQEVMDSYLHRPVSSSSRYFYELSGWGRGLVSAEPPLGPGLCLTRPGHPPGGRGPGPSFQMRKADAARGHVTQDLCCPPPPSTRQGPRPNFYGCVLCWNLTRQTRHTCAYTHTCTRTHPPTHTTQAHTCPHRGVCITHTHATHACAQDRKST